MQKAARYIQKLDLSEPGDDDGVWDDGEGVDDGGRDEARDVSGVLGHLAVVHEVLVHREGDPRRQRHQKDVADGARQPTRPESCTGKIHIDS